MVRVGILRIQNPIVNVFAAVVVFIAAFTIFADQDLLARVIIFAVGFVLLGRAGFTFYQQNMQKETRTDRFQRFAEEEKEVSKEQENIEPDTELEEAPAEENKENNSAE